MGEPMLVAGTFVVGDAGETWVDCDLTPEEQAEAREWIAKHHRIAPGLSLTIRWQRSKRVVGTICPRPTCKAFGTLVSSHLATQPVPHKVDYYGCEKCGRTWRVARHRDRDRIYTIS
jgi:hypothetical protein